MNEQERLEMLNQLLTIILKHRCERGDLSEDPVKTLERIIKERDYACEMLAWKLPLCILPEKEAAKP